jgi:hypothetical protein
VIDAHGASPSYLVALGGGVVAALAALALPTSWSARVNVEEAGDLPVP